MFTNVIIMQQKTIRSKNMKMNPSTHYTPTENAFTISGSTELDGYVVAIHNSDNATLDKWLTMENPVDYIKHQIYKKHICVDVSSPENELNQTIAPNVIALDSSFHRNSFHHGSFEYHSPFLGWRGWYGASILGWEERIFDPDKKLKNVKVEAVANEVIFGIVGISIA